MTKNAEIVIVGAGIVGCSTAYWLAKYGAKDVLVIDKGELFENDGSTSHAPGGVNPLSNNTTMAKLAADSIDLYEGLPMWKPQRRPMHMVGGVDVARTPERMEEIKRLHSNAKGFGVESHIIGPKEIEELVPFLRGDLFLGAIHTPRKPVAAGAYVSGSLATEAEKMGGVEFVGHTKAIEFIQEGGRITGVKTNNPEMPLIRCEKVLMCTNIWTPAVSELAGVTIPLLSAEHQYLITDPLEALADFSDRSDNRKEIAYPSVRDLDGGLYYRHFWDSLGIGSYHHRPIMVRPQTLGKVAEHDFTEEDWVEAHAMAVESIPALNGATYRRKFNGMFSFSVDGLPILGETSTPGLWVAAAVWLTNAGGVGKAMAQWLLTGETESDMRALNVNRFLPYQLTDTYIQISATKAYVEVHDVIHPAQPVSKPRNVRLTPFHQRHEEMRATYAPSAGLEIPYWLGENSRLLEAYDDQIPERSGWSSMYWSPIQGAEHLAMRDSAGLFDLTSLAIIEVEGPDAEAFMDYVATGRMTFDVGKVAYTLFCTHSGGIKRDVAIARKAEDQYWIFTGNGTLPQEIDWLETLNDSEFKVTIRDRSQHFAALGLFGPNARKVLEKVTRADVSNGAFPLYTWQAIDIGMSTVYAMRISYVGELGWELHMPMDEGLAVRDLLWEAGREFNLISAGVGAMRSMRVEKGYRLWGADIYTEHNPYEAGMGWMVKLKKKRFVGKEALQNLKKEPLKRRLVTLTIDGHPSVIPTGNEPIYFNGDPDVVGQVTSGNYGYSVGKYVGFGYVPIEMTEPGTHLEVEYLNERFPAVVEPDCPFDPENARMKG